MKRSEQTLMLSKDFSEFIQDMEERKSPFTVSGYRQAMHQFYYFLEKTKRLKINDFNIGCFTKKNIEKFMNWMIDVKHVSKMTCNTRVSQILAFFKYMKHDPVYLPHYIQLQDVARIRMTSNLKVVEPLSRDAIKALIAAPGTSTDTGLRYTALFAFLYSSATRIDEALSIKIKDLNLRGRHAYVTVIGKGRRKRTVYLNGKVVRILNVYIRKNFGENPDPESYLFYSRSKGFFAKTTSRGVNKQLEVYCKKASKDCKSMPSRVHSHQFRHSMATHCLEDGMNLFQISKMLGHKNINTTMIYLGFTLNMMRDAVSRIETVATKSIHANWKYNAIDIKKLF